MRHASTSSADFNSFFFAADMVAALREAGRVAKPGGEVVIQVWGMHGTCDLDAIKPIVRPFFPRRRPECSPSARPLPSPAFGGTRVRRRLDTGRRSTSRGPTSTTTRTR